VTPAWACYAEYPDFGWVVDTGVGGTYSFDVTQCKEWASPEDARAELEACDLVYSESRDLGWMPPIQRYRIVRVR
jgi:hypothetical protein